MPIPHSFLFHSPLCRLLLSPPPLAPPSLPSLFFSAVGSFSMCFSVSQRIPLVAQLRDSAGKLKLFKARSAGKASSWWREAAWTRPNSPCVYTQTQTYTSCLLHMHNALLACLSAFQIWEIPLHQRFCSLFWFWTFGAETRVAHFQHGTYRHVCTFCGGLMVSIFVNWISQIHWSHLCWWHI